MTDLCYKLLGDKRTFIYAEADHTTIRRQAIKKDLVPNDARSYMTCCAKLMIKLDRLSE
jgi:hypothetical protein